MDIIVGPYLGGLEQELFTFRPYAMWLYMSLQTYRSSFYISTHEQHRFLYDWPDVNFIPVDHKFSNHSDQSGIMNSQISNKDYLGLVKQLKNSIGVNGDTIHCSVRYTKYDNYIVPISKKIFNKIDLQVNNSNDILIISRNSDLNIVKKLCKIMPELIEINGDCDSIELLKQIMAAKMVICPVGPWTCFCNLHQIPVFSWGVDGVGMYKPDGAYYFNNTRSHIVYHGDSSVAKLLSGIEYTKEMIRG